MQEAILKSYHVGYYILGLVFNWLRSRKGREACDYCSIGLCIPGSCYFIAALLFSDGNFTSYSRDKALFMHISRTSCGLVTLTYFMWFRFWLVLYCRWLRGWNGTSNFAGGATLSTSPCFVCFFTLPYIALPCFALLCFAFLC
jgi:hypothetical protein